MSPSTVPQDKQVLPLWQEIDNAFAPLSDPVDAASNVLEAFGELTGDPNAQAAIIGPKLRETYEAVYERVLALARGHEVQTAGETLADMLQHFDELFGGLVELANASITIEQFSAPMTVAHGRPMKREVAWFVHELKNELVKVSEAAYARESAMEVRHAS